MSDPASDRHRWIRGPSAGELAVAACITCVVGRTGPEVRGVLAAAATPDVGPIEIIEMPSFVVVVVEPNGWQGSRTEVLTTLSVGGMAASCCWNVNAVVRVGFSRDGALLAAFEDWPETAWGATPALALDLAADLDFGDDDRAVLGLVLVERFTGASLTPALLDR